MESLMNRMYKKKAAEQQPSASSSSAAQTSNFARKDGQTTNVKEIDNQSMVSSQPSFTKEKPKQKIPLADTRKGKILDTAAAFIGLPHICSNE